jgi:hypothetical protein
MSALLNTLETYFLFGEKFGLMAGLVLRDIDIRIAAAILLG